MNIRWRQLFHLATHHPVAYVATNLSISVEAQLPDIKRSAPQIHFAIFACYISWGTKAHISFSAFAIMISSRWAASINRGCSRMYLSIPYEKKRGV